MASMSAPARVPNPIVFRARLVAFPAWELRRYLDGTWDAVSPDEDAYGLTPVYSRPLDVVHHLCTEEA